MAMLYTSALLLCRCSPQQPSALVAGNCWTSAITVTDVGLLQRALAIYIAYTPSSLAIDYYAHLINSTLACNVVGGHGRQEEVHGQF